MFFKYQAIKNKTPLARQKAETEINAKNFSKFVIFCSLFDYKKSELFIK